MKKWSIMAAMMLIMVLVVVGCTQAIPEEPVPMSDTTEDTMEKDDMKEDTMDKEDVIRDDSMDKEDDMKDESMDKEDDMKDDSMDKDDEMAEPMMKNEGSSAPAFSLTDLNGNKVALSDYAGEKVYVKFWASWCSICVSGLPELDELAGEMNDFKVITIVSPDYKGEQSAEDFKAWFANKNTENIIVLLDVDGEISKTYGVRGYPTSAYIGSDGVLIKTLPGHASNELVKEAFTTIY